MFLSCVADERRLNYKARPEMRFTDESCNDEHSEEPADINTISRKAQNTKDDYQKITVEGGREVFNGKNWKWFNQI